MRVFRVYIAFIRRQSARPRIIAWLSFVRIQLQCSPAVRRNRLLLLFSRAARIICFRLVISQRISATPSQQNNDIHWSLALPLVDLVFHSFTHSHTHTPSSYPQPPSCPALDSSLIYLHARTGTGYITRNAITECKLNLI